MKNKQKYQAFLTDLSSEKIQQDVPLKKHTYFQIGGPADLFYQTDTQEELIKLTTLAQKHKVPFIILGGGSNVLVTDKGYRGLIIKNKTNKISLLGFTGDTKKGKTQLKTALVKAQSGTPANQLITHTISKGLRGLEDFLGLPGTVGGAIYNNSHHIGKLIGDLVSKVEVLNKDGKIKSYSQKEMDFSYDYSILQETKEVILSAVFKLEKGNKKKLQQKSKEAVERRSDTQPLGQPSSGCIFKNFSLKEAIRLGTPDHTCSTGYLIDKAGLKGTKIGGAKISEKHANFIVNTGRATYKDVKKLIDLIKKTLKKKYNVKIELEIFILGER